MTQLPGVPGTLDLWATGTLGRWVTYNSMSLINKRVLITAGPTWVSLDSVRVISNIATGETGILLARQATKQGAKVTLLLGPVTDTSLAGLSKRIDLIRFRFFEELKNKVVRELRSKSYDLIIHCAAVSDFKPARQNRGKLDSGRGHNLRLVPLPKIITDIRRFARAAVLVIFKLEAGISDKALIERARSALIASGGSIAVANRLNPYRAYIIGRKNNIVPANSKSELAKKLIRILDLRVNY